MVAQRRGFGYKMQATEEEMKSQPAKQLPIKIALKTLNQAACIKLISCCSNVDCSFTTCIILTRTDSASPKKKYATLFPSRTKILSVNIRIPHIAIHTAQAQKTIEERAVTKCNFCFPSDFPPPQSPRRKAMKQNKGKQVLTFSGWRQPNYELYLLWSFQLVANFNCTKANKKLFYFYSFAKDSFNNIGIILKHSIEP